VLGLVVQGETQLRLMLTGYDIHVRVQLSFQWRIVHFSGAQ
jgi:hypothetical protein